ncbi:MAG: hypothetical protein Unbinned400contig1004_21 [Prokaryotic dsDNA virus sp.]|nr:MAG: hypothetical protein Unbinned400contig1004_21 [Prokaryotic dsDNA virus sp.]|tara:strand:- start:18291 stop:18434 length:144 start_codon:yes stop_codon:yes gene_type:complete
MKWLKNKTGAIIGKVNPSKKQLEEYIKQGFKEVDETGKEIKAKKSKK